MRQKWDDFWELFEGMRKFLLMLIVFVIAIVFRAKDLFDGAQALELIKDVTLAYMAANGFEYVGTAVQTHYDAKAGVATTDTNTLKLETPASTPVIDQEAIVQEAQTLKEETENGQ